MAELAVGYVSLLASLRGGRKQIVNQVKGAGDEAGKQFSNEFGSEAEKGGKEGGKRLSGALLTASVAGAALAGAAIAKGVGDALEREKLGDKTAASLGLTEKQSAKAGSVAGKLYAGAWGENMPAVTDAVESVISSIDGMANTTPKRLHDVTAGVLDIATAFDIDASQAATNVGILIKQGLAKDAEEGVDLITASLQRVPKALRGEVTDATQEYSQFFADLGYTGSEALGLLVSATEDGAYGVDKMGDAIKEFTIRGTDMSKSTKDAYSTLRLNSRDTTNELLAGGDRAKQAFQTIIDGVKGIKDPAKQAETAIALFGTPLEDLGTNEIPAFLDGLTGTATSLGNVDGAAAKMGDTLNDNLATKIESVKRGAEVFVSGALMSMFTWFEKNRAVISLVAFVVGTAAVAWGVYALATQGIPALIAAVRAAQIALNAALIANPIGLVVVAIGALVGALVWLYQNNQTVRRVIDAVWAGIKVAIGATVDWLVGTAWPWIQKVWNGIKIGLEVAWTAIRIIFATWATVFALLWKGISFVWSKTGAPLFAAIRQVASATWNWLRDRVFTPVRIGFQVMALGLQVIKNRVIDPVWNGIKTAASAAWNWIRDKAFAPLRAGLDAMGEVFKATKRIISAAWDGIKAAAAKPINFIIETVYTKGIKATWDKIAKSVGLDLVLPTVKPIAYANGGVENHTAQIARAGAMRLWAEPETGGEAYIPLSPSKRGRSTAILETVASKFGYGLTQFEDGGIWGWAGDLWDSAKAKASAVAKVLSNPVGALGDMLSKPLESALGSIGGGSIGKIAAQLPRKAVSALIDKAKSLVGALAPASGKGGPAMGWENMWRVVSGAFPGATLNSAYRPGAITAVGTPSYHGQGRAIDVSPSMAIFNWLAKTFPNSTELIYSPAGGRQLYKGQQTLFGEPTRGDHWDHVHWAMQNGGILPKVYDQGGWMNPGDIGMNRGPKPEAVLTPAESEGLKDGLHRRPARNLVFNTTRVTTRDVLFALDVADLHDVGSPA